MSSAVGNGLSQRLMGGRKKKIISAPVRGVQGWCQEKNACDSVEAGCVLTRGIRHMIQSTFCILFHRCVCWGRRIGL